jgi:hypothetical protein
VDLVVVVYLLLLQQLVVLQLRVKVLLVETVETLVLELEVELQE